jgi:alpha-1,4-digalacturonate transport system permease protein
MRRPAATRSCSGSGPYVGAENFASGLVLTLIRAVQAFDEIYALTGGGPGPATTLILQYIYDTGFSARPRLFGVAAAASILMAVLFTLTLAQLRVTRRRAAEA